MGGSHGKPKLIKEDLEFLKKNTSFSEQQIREWYKGFVVRNLFFTVFFAKKLFIIKIDYLNDYRKMWFLINYKIWHSHLNFAENNYRRNEICKKIPFWCHHNRLGS